MILGFSFEWARRGGDYFREMYQVAPLSIENIFYHVTFLNFFHQKYLLTLTGIDSMIPLEFFFYLWIPLFYFLAKKSFFLFLPVLLLGIFFYFNPSIHLPIYYTYFAGGELTFERNLLTYSTGIIYFLLFFSSFKEKYPTLKKIILMVIGGAVLIYIWNNFATSEKYIFIGLVFIFFYSQWVKQKLVTRFKQHIVKSLFINSDLILLISLFIYFLTIQHVWINIFTMLFFGVLTVCCLNGGKLKSLLFENKVILYIGEISFSFYLAHLVILTTVGKMLANNNLLSFLLLFIITAGIATITHKYIEAPFYRPRASVVPANRKNKFYRSLFK